MTNEQQPAPLSDDPLTEIVFAVAKALGFAFLGPSNAASGIGELFRQEAMLKARPTLLAPADTVEAHRRGEITDAEHRNQLTRAGFTDRAISVLGELEQQLLSAGEVLALWRRGEIAEGETDSRLEKLGIEGPTRELIKALRFEVPSVQDVIRFTVREVFNPNLRAALQLDADFPEDSVSAFEAAGANPERARDEWAAHWDLPSIQLAFEMLHRREIEESDIDLILRARDVLPRFRESIKAVAFNPLTRVDVRRMHALGLLDDEQLQLRYQDIGFSPDNAAMMVDFTKAFNAPKTPRDDEETRGLTRTQIERFFREGLFTFDEATNGLVDIGFSEDNAATILSLIELSQFEAQRKAQIKVIENRFENGTIDFNDALGLLDELELPAIQRDLLLTEFEAERQSQIRTPSRAELDRFFKNDIIGREEYIAGLFGLGYQEPWPNRFAALIEAGLAEDE